MRWDYQKSLRKIEEIGGCLYRNCLQLVDAFRSSNVPVEELYIPRDGHWTIKGHTVVAEAIFNSIRAAVCGHPSTEIN